MTRCRWWIDRHDWGPWDLPVPHARHCYRCSSIQTVNPQTGDTRIHPPERA